MLNILRKTHNIYTSNEQSKNEVKKTIIVIISLKIIKYLGINLTKEVQTCILKTTKYLL